MVVFYIPLTQLEYLMFPEQLYTSRDNIHPFKKINGLFLEQF